MVSRRYCPSHTVPFRYLFGVWQIGAADPAAHKIYIWDLSNDGQLSSTLDGGRVPLIHVHVILISFLRLVVGPEYAFYCSGIHTSPPSHPPRVRAAFLSGIAQHLRDGVHLPVVLKKQMKTLSTKSGRTNSTL